MADETRPIEVKAVPEVEMVGTEKFGVNKLEVDRTMDIGDSTELVFRGELIEKRDDIWVFRKVGPAKATGDVNELSVEEMRRKLPKADR